MAIRNYKIGNAVTDTPGDLKTMAARVTATDNYMTFEQFSVDYQVPVGKTLYITKIIMRAASASSVLDIGYGDTGVGNGAAAPTNAKRHGDATFINPTANTSAQWEVWIPIPATKYPFAFSNANAMTVSIYGIEV